MSDPPSVPYFVDGGTLRPDTPSYVRRPTDDELFNALLEGEYCYILTPRQMGKSSLMIQTSQRLRELNVRTAVVDFQATGTNKIHEWYGSVLSQIRRGLRLSIDIDEWFQQKGNVGYGQLFVDFIQDVVLGQISEQVVIFIDEVDWMIKVDFRDDFFASIRAIYNARAEYPDLKRISFVLLGVASPAELIAEPTRTPFNIGHPIALQEFTLEDASVLERGIEIKFPSRGTRILRRIFHWTDGHPYLTQKLCKTIAEKTDESWTDEDIDDLVKRLFLTEQARKEANLKFIQDRILNNDQRVALLNTYKQILRSKVREDGQSVVQNQLKLSGLLKAENGILTVRNRIYLTVFNAKWIKENQPWDWQRFTIVLLGFLLFAVVAAFTTVYILDRGKTNEINQYRLEFNAALTDDSPKRQIESLAKILRTRGILLDLDQDNIVRDLFFNALNSNDKQKALFDYSDVDADNVPSHEDLVTVIRGIYYSLAMTDPEKDNTDLLILMRDSLSEKDSPLYMELDHWVNAREDEGENAIKSYGSAININASNPALYYERALVRLTLGDPWNQNFVLEDLDQVARIAGVPNQSNLPTVTQPSTELSSTVTETLDVTQDVTSTFTPLTFATATIQSKNTATPLIGETLIGNSRTPSPTLNPATRTQAALVATATRPPTFTPEAPTPSRTPRPILSPMPTLSPTPDKFGSTFFYERDVVYFDAIAAIEKVLQSHPDLNDQLANNRDYYKNLRDAGLIKIYSTFTPTFTPTPTSTPAIKIDGLIPTDLPEISRENVANIRVLSRLGRGTVLQAVYSPDGTMLAVASSRGVYFYNAGNLENEGFIETTNLVTKVAFSQDGRTLAVALADNRISFWDVESRDPVGNVLIGHSGLISTLAFSPDGTTLVSGSEDTTVRLWRISDGRLLPSFEDLDEVNEAVRSVAFSPDGQFLAAATDNDVYIWNMSESKLQWQFSGNNVAFFPDGQKIAVSSGISVSVYNMANGFLLLQDTSEGGRHVAISKDGQTIAFVSPDNDIRLLQVAESELRPQTLGTNIDAITSISFSPNGQTLVSTSTDNLIRLWRVGARDLLQVVEDHVSSPYIALSPDGRLLASGSPDGSIDLWSLGDGEITQTFTGHLGFVRTLAFSPDGQMLATGADDDSIRLWGVGEGIPNRTLRGHTDVVWSVMFSTAGNAILSGSEDGTVRVWDLRQPDDESSPEAFSPGGIRNAVYSIASSDDGKVLAFGLEDDAFWGVSNGVADIYRAHNGAVRSVDVSSDGKFIASGSEDNTVRLWSVSSTSIGNTETLVGHTADVTSVAFSPDGTILASGSEDGTVRLWDINEGILLRVLSDHRDAVLSIAFSPDGTFIVSGSLDGTINIWGVP